MRTSFANGAHNFNLNSEDIRIPVVLQEMQAGYHIHYSHKE